MWPAKYHHGIREMLVQKGSKAVQNIDYEYKEVLRPGQGGKLKGGTRKLSRSLFFRTLENGEKILRTHGWYILYRKNLCFVFVASYFQIQTHILVQLMVSNVGGR